MRLLIPTIPAGCSGSSGSERAFTLVELMIVISIIAIVLATGVPSLLRSLQKEGLRKAEADLLEACSHARAQAILSGAPMELVIRAENGQITVEPAKAIQTGLQSEEQNSPGASSLRSAPKTFSARVADDIAIRLLDVNFKDQMEFPETRVHFYPDGTSDEFTIVFFSDRGERKISLDVVTALADVEVIR